MDFLEVKKTQTKKKKLMLWIDRELIEKLDEIKPAKITTQEAIRQIVKGFIEDAEALGGL